MDDKEDITRRGFIKGAAAGAASLAMTGCSSGGLGSLEAFFQSHFKEMDKDELMKTLKRLEREYSEKYGRDFVVRADKPIEGTLFGYGLDISRCIGCRRCVYACVEENNQSRDPQIHWITVLRFKKGEKWLELEEADKYYEPEKVPEDGYFYVPVSCQQCEKPPAQRCARWGRRGKSRTG